MINWKDTMSVIRNMVEHGTGEVDGDSICELFGEFECENCGKKFMRESDMLEHMQVEEIKDNNNMLLWEER
jgi:hypothetical protein